MSLLEKNSIIAWLDGMKTETGKPIDLSEGYFMYDIFRDFSPLLAIQKPAQVRATTTQILKVFWGMERFGLDAIYTLPTVSDAQEMSKAKIGRLISQNPKLQAMVRDMDTVGQKMVGKNMLYLRGTFVEKAAMMFPSDWNLHDEIDSSNQEIIEQYETRLQHSKRKWQHFFSHPNAGLNVGINKVFNKTDQKHWFITCPHCNKKQFLSFPESICEVRRIYQCKKCKKELSDNDRRVGEWVQKYRNRDGSGYQINLLMAVWVSANDILKYHEEKSLEYFQTRVLGLPYVGEGNKVTWDTFLKNITFEDPDLDDRVIIGVDTGGEKHFVVGTRQGVFYYGKGKGYEEIERLLEMFDNSIVVIDGNGDPTATEVLFEKWRGRVFKCFFVQDRKTQELCRWGKDKDAGIVHADRNRLIQRVVDEFTDQKIALFAQEKPEDFYDYFLHWDNMYREEEENALGVPIKKWKRQGADHWGLATCYYRVGVDKFGQGMAKIVRKGGAFVKPNNSYRMNPTMTAQSPSLDKIWRLNK